MNELDRFRGTFQPVLDRTVAEGLARVRALTRDAHIRGIAEYAAHVAQHDGKRLRPYLAVVMYCAAHGTHTRDALRLSVALEIFHAFALIHDDIMDQGTLRHGVRTVHTEVARRYRATRRRGDAARGGESQAILAGDLLLTWAIEILSRPAHIPVAQMDAARRIFTELSEEVIVGQMLDVDLPARRKTTRATIIEKMRRKTAGYSFVKPLQFGAALAGAPAKTHRWCEEFGTALGLAFQIQDDLLDLQTPSSVSHKTPFSDLAERQQTIFTQHILERGTPAARRELETLWSSTLTEKDRPRVERLFVESGAIAAGNALIKSYFTRSESLLTRSAMAQEDRATFAQLIDWLRTRTR